MKFVIVALIICAIVFSSNAQVNVGPNIGVAGVVGFPPSDLFLNILQIRAQKLLATPGGLPADLEQRVVSTQSNAETAFADCNANGQATMPWLQIRCIKLQLKLSQSELQAIEDEANARAAAAATTAAAPAAPAAVV